MTRGHDTPAPGAKTAGPAVRALFGYAFAVGGLVWVFHDLSWSELHPVLRRIGWGWIAGAIAADLASYVAQGLRWSLLLRPLGSLSTVAATQAIYAGLFVNELVPMRVGEVVRAWIVSARLGVAAAEVIPAIAVERVFDGAWVAIAIALAAAWAPLPPALVRAGDWLGIAIGAALLLLLALALRAPASAAGPRGAVGRFLARQAAGLRAIGRSPRAAVAGLVSAAVLLLQGIAYWLVMRACGIALGPGPGLVAFLVMHAGTALPNAPGNVGSYQLFSVLGLTLFGVDKAEAAAFSVAAFVLLTVPLWVLGWLALTRSGLTLRSVRERLRRSPRAGDPR